MADNYFEVLGLERRAALTEDEVRQAFQAVSKDLHPDRQQQGQGEGEDEGGAEAEAFEEVTQAFRVLRDPAARVKHLLALEFPGEDPGGGNMASGALLDLFSRTGEVMQVVDDVLRRKAAAVTALGKAMLAREEFAAQQGLQESGFEIDRLLRDEEARLPELDRLLETDRAAAAALGRELTERFAFLTKWQAKVREKLTAFLVAD